LERLAPAKRQARTRAEGPTGQEKFLLFRVGEEIYGMGLRGLREVLLPDGVTPLPSPSYQVCVALEHRGRRIPVIRMRGLFEGSPAGEPPTARVLLTQGQARPIGLLVDEVLEMANVEPARIGPVPALATLLDPSCFRGLFTRQDRIILLVNEDGLGGLDEVVQFYETGS
jgi:purine-binding chemotaxis protein CheW